MEGEEEGKVLVGGLQVTNAVCVTKEDKQKNLEHCGELMRAFHEERIKAGKAPPDIYLIGECATIGYDPSTFDALHLLAEKPLLSEPSFAFFSQLCKDLQCYVCFGFARILSPKNEDSEEKYSISSAVINPEGNIEVIYDKSHICQYGSCSENKWFCRASEVEQGELRPGYAVFSVKGVKFGIAVCYDIRFPEFFRKLALEYSVDAVLHPNGWYKDMTFPSWHPFVKTRALENGIYIMSTNYAGNMNGSSMFCPPWVDYDVSETVFGDEEGVLLGVVDKSVINNVRSVCNYRRDMLPHY